MSALRQENPNICLVSHNIYNARKRQKQSALGGNTPAQALVKALELSSYYHRIKTDESGCLTHIFFAHPKSLLQLQSYPDVLLMDCTYKTNRFKIPFLTIVGSTNLNTTFFVAFILLLEEVVEDYM
jgi:MULE transposase domain